MSAALAMMAAPPAAPRNDSMTGALARCARVLRRYDVSHPPGRSAADCDVVDALWWMSWQPLSQFSGQDRDRIESLAAAGAVELMVLGGGSGPPTHARLAVRVQP